MLPTDIAQKHCTAYFKKWAYPGLVLFIFGLFNQTIQILQQINVKNVISKPRPLEHESPSITTRPTREAYLWLPSTKIEAGLHLTVLLPRKILKLYDVI